MRDAAHITCELENKLEVLGYDAYYVNKGDVPVPVGNTLSECWQEDILCIHRGK
jgi:hypothetical protein